MSEIYHCRHLGKLYEFSEIATRWYMRSGTRSTKTEWRAVDDRIKIRPSPASADRVIISRDRGRTLHAERFPGIRANITCRNAVLEPRGF